MLIAIMATALSACTPTPLDNATSFTRNGVRFTSPEAALEARRTEAEISLASLPTETDPVLGKLRIVIPDQDRLRPYAASRLSDQSRRTPVEIRYLVSDGDLVMHIDAEALIRTHAFQHSETIQINDTLDPDSGDADFVLWFQIAPQPYSTSDAWTGRWLVRRVSSPAIQPVGFDAGTRPLSTAAYASFLKNIRQAALNLGGKTMSGANPLATSAMIKTSGSGVIVDERGHVVTNDHVVPACRSIHVFNGNHDVEAVVVGRDTVNDLALLKLPMATPRAAVTFRNGAALRAGEDVIVTGFPLPSLLSSDMSITSGSVTSLKGLHNDTRMVQISAPVQPGNSGGPLLDETGAAVGIISRTLNPEAVDAALGAPLPQNVNFAIKAEVILPFLSANEIGYERNVATRRISTPDIADKAQKFTVRIECR